MTKPKIKSTTDAPSLSDPEFFDRYFAALNRACLEPSDAGNMLLQWLRMNGLTDKFIREWEMLADTHDVEVVDDDSNPVDITE